MHFHELAVNDKFIFNGVKYIKIPEERANCCKVRANCKNIDNEQKVALKPLENVEKIS